MQTILGANGVIGNEVAKALTKAGGLGFSVKIDEGVRYETN